MSETGKLAKDKNIITLMLRAGVEQMIHTEPILDIKGDTIICDGLMVITITPGEVNDDRFVEAVVKIYSYSNKFKFIFSNKPDYPKMADGEPVDSKDPEFIHLINIDVSKKNKDPQGELFCDEKSLYIEAETKCAIWTEKNGKINDVVITLDDKGEGIRQENRDDTKASMSGDQICKYRWVR